MRKAVQISGYMDLGKPQELYDKNLEVLENGG